jgi:hypothetical protein
MCRPPKIGHTKKPLKSHKIMENYLKERPKKLTKYLVFTHPKMAFYFWTRTFGVLKIKAESYKFCLFPKVNIRKRSKKLTKCLVFEHPKMAFYFWTRTFGVFKKQGRILQIQLFSQR